MPVELIVDSDIRSQQITETLLHRWLSALAGVNDDPRLKRDICLRICDAETSRTLNRTYRDRDTSTNILSFPAEIDVPDPPLGDLALCWSVVEREAGEQGKSVQDHCAHLFIHGVLHLLGYDHEEAVAAAAMEALEVATLAHLEIANPYE